MCSAPSSPALTPNPSPASGRGAWRNPSPNQNPSPACGRGARGEGGVTLIEVILFIVILSVALMAIVNLLGLTTANSGDPLIRRQNLAIGESLIQEIDAVPYHLKDPYNPNGPNDAIGPEAGESRSGSVLPFDNPNDYSGYSENGIVAPDGTAISGLSTYSASVVASQQALGNIPSNAGLLVTVTVTGPNSEPISISSFRAMYAP